MKFNSKHRPWTPLDTALAAQYFRFTLVAGYAPTLAAIAQAQAAGKQITVPILAKMLKVHPTNVWAWIRQLQPHGLVVKSAMRWQKGTAENPLATTRPGTLTLTETGLALVHDHPFELPTHGTQK